MCSSLNLLKKKDKLNTGHQKLYKASNLKSTRTMLGYLFNIINLLFLTYLCNEKHKTELN